MNKNKQKLLNLSKAISRSLVSNKIKLGDLKKPNHCEFNNNNCKGRIEAHHSDYSEPLNIRWLCQKHHKAWHKIFKDETPEGFAWPKAKSILKDPNAKNNRFLVLITKSDLKAIEAEAKKRGEWSRAKVALDLIREAIRHSSEAK